MVFRIYRVIDWTQYLYTEHITKMNRKAKKILEDSRFQSTCTSKLIKRQVLKSSYNQTN